MTPIDIRYRLSLQRTTQTDIARRCGVTQPSVWQVIEGLHRSKRIEDCISAATGHKLEELWPQWYGPEASRRRRRNRGAMERLSVASGVGRA